MWQGKTDIFLVYFYFGNKKQQLPFVDYQPHERGGRQQLLSSSSLLLYSSFATSTTTTTTNNAINRIPANLYYCITVLPQELQQKWGLQQQHPQKSINWLVWDLRKNVPGMPYMLLIMILIKLWNYYY